MSQPLSLRLPDATLDRLGARARSRSVAPRTLAQRYVEEGLRTDEHPLIRFVDGPAGRRPRLQGTGLDVWEAISVLRDNDGDEKEAAEYLTIPLGLVQAAGAYYGATAKRSTSGSSSTRVRMRPRTLRGSRGSKR